MAVLAVVALAVGVVGCESGSSGPSRAEEAGDGSAPTTAPIPGSSGTAHVEGEYTCGPTDGGWIDVDVVPSELADVYATLDFEGETISRSDVVAASDLSQFGFAASLDSAVGRAAYVEGYAVVALRQESGEILATDRVRLRLPDGVSCG